MQTSHTEALYGWFLHQSSAYHMSFSLYSHRHVLSVSCRLCALLIAWCNVANCSVQGTSFMYLFIGGGLSLMTIFAFFLLVPQGATHICKAAVVTAINNNRRRRINKQLNCLQNQSMIFKRQAANVPYSGLPTFLYFVNWFCWKRKIQIRRRKKCTAFILILVKVQLISISTRKK